MKLRNSAKAVLVHEGRVLLTRCADKTGEWLCCPGGGQQPGETLAQAVQRECMEETGALVEVGRMLAVLEWHDHRNGTHAVEHYFLCSLQPGSTPSLGAIPDTKQIGVEWVDLERIPETVLKPKAMRQVMGELDGVHYLGLVEFHAAPKG